MGRIARFRYWLIIASAFAIICLATWQGFTTSAEANRLIAVSSKVLTATIAFLLARDAQDRYGK